jgi:hypothetical protein
VGDVLVVAADEPRNLERRKPKALMLVELWVVDRREVLDVGQEPRWKPGFLHAEHGPLRARHRVRSWQTVSCAADSDLQSVWSHLYRRQGCERLVEALGRQTIDLRQKAPLVRVGLEGAGIDEHGVFLFARPAVERQRDQVSEAALGQEILVRKEAIVAVEVDLAPLDHRFSQKPSG